MGRGGGVVAGSKHSAEHDDGDSGPADPRATAISLVIVGIILLICAIAVPIVLVKDPPGDSCSPADTLNRKEQAICIPDSYDYDWIVDTDSTGKKYGKFYKAANKSLKFITSTFTWLNYETKLKGSYDYFGFSVPYFISGRFMVYCDGKKCDDIKMYFMTKNQFLDSVDENDEFHEKTYKATYKKFDDEQWNYFTYSAPGPEYYYLVFSLKKDKKAKIKYSIEMINTLVDTSNMTAFTGCDGTRCTFENMKDGEMLVAEYPTDDTYAECVDNPVIPEYFEINMHNNRVDMTGAIATGVVLGLLGIVCIVVGIILIKILF